MQRKLTTLTFAGAMAGTWMLAGAAMAGEKPVECSCVTAAQPNVTEAGSVLAAEGSVLVTKKTGLMPAGVGDILEVGSRVVVGPNSQAAISVGSSCQLNIQQNTEVSIPQTGNNLCVRIEPVSAGLPTQLSNVPTPSQTVGQTASDDDDLCDGDNNEDSVKCALLLGAVGTGGAALAVGLGGTDASN